MLRPGCRAGAHVDVGIAGQTPAIPRALNLQGGVGAGTSLGVESAREMPALSRDPDIEMCARTASGAEHELLHGPPGVVFLRKRMQIRSHVVDRSRGLE